MPFLPSLPEEATVATMWEVYNPQAREGLSLFSRSFMRNEGKLTPADKELIAAYTSALNESDYCFSGHSRVAINLGYDESVFDPLIEDLATAPVRDELKPLLAFIRVLTLTPAKVKKEDVQALLDMGWDEQSLHEAMAVCARFSMMNRLTLGHGLVVDEERRARDALNMNYEQS
jgi:uncharacterized peroxidase-related enzyme